MRNLLAFVKQFRGFVAFAFLQFIALYFYFQYMNYGNARLYNASSSLVGWVQLQKSAASDYFYLKQENQRLLQENAELRANMPSSFLQLQKDVFYINDTLYERQFQYTPAHVINSTYSKRDNFITLDLGKKNGVKFGMGVMSNTGIVGYVVDASEHFSLVKTVLSKEFNLSAKHKKSQFFGLIKWDGSDPSLAQLKGIPNDAPIDEGDSIVTKGASGFFPANIPIGIVEKIESEAGHPHYFIDIKLANNFKSTFNVYVLENLYKKEMKNLESKVQKKRNE